MKFAFGIGFLLLMNPCVAQRNQVSFSEIDYSVQHIDSKSLPELANSITAPYRSQLEKTRALFSWIAFHIAYKVKNPYHVRSMSNAAYRSNPTTDTGQLESVDQLVAKAALLNRSALCEGYARLFKVLCEYSGIPCMLLKGYAKTNLYGNGQKFRSNHYWNAVFVDSSWHLLDVTWGSGFTNSWGTEFTARFDDSYFFSSPEEFIKDHFPDNLQWALLPKIPAVPEFERSPFRSCSYIKYHIAGYYPSVGLIETKPGDTVHIELASADPIADSKIAPDTAGIDTSGNIISVRPASHDGKTLVFEFVADNLNIEWVQVIYNQDMVLRYRLKFKKEKGNLAALSAAPANKAGMP